MSAIFRYQAQCLNKMIDANNETQAHIYLEQLQAFSEVNRVGKNRVITFSFFALVKPEQHELAAYSDTIETNWCSICALPSLIYDHNEILNVGIKFLRNKIRYQPIGVNLLPPKFTLGQLQELYEVILATKLDKPNFRRKILRMDLLVSCKETQKKVPYRAGALYRFDPERYEKLCKKGFNFEL